MSWSNYDAWRTGYPEEWDDDRPRFCDVDGIVKTNGRVYSIFVRDFQPTRWTFSNGNELDDMSGLDIQILVREKSGWVDCTQDWHDGEISNELVAGIEKLCLNTFEDLGCVTDEEAKDDGDHP